MNTIWNSAIGQCQILTHTNWYEFPTEDPGELEVWCDTDQISYAPGDTANFHTSTTAETYTIGIVRYGAEPEVV
jgi:hypothetical protein